MNNDILVRVGADISDFSRKMAEGSSQLQKFGQENQAAFDSFKKVGALAVGAGTAIAGGLGLAVNKAADFESAMSNVKAISGATGSDFDSLRSKAIEMGNATAFSASESADAMANLAQMGWETDEILGGIEHTLNLAAAGGLELADSAMIMANTMNQFGLETQDAQRVADVMAKTAASAGTDVYEMGEAMKYAGANAHAAGMSIEETSAFIGVLGDAGISGSKAGTALNAMLRDLKSSAEDGAIAVGDQSVALYDSEGNTRNMVDVVRDLVKATDGMTDSQRDATLSTILGEQALQGFNAIAGQGADAVANLTSELENSKGTAEEMARIQMENLKGALTELSSAFEGVLIAVGSALIPALEALALGLKSVLDWFNGLSESTQNIVAYIAALTSVLLIVGGAMMIVVGFLPQIVSGFQILSGVVRMVGTAFTGLSIPMIAIVAVIGLVVAAIIHLWRTNEEFRNNITAIWTNIKSIFASVWEAIQYPAMTFIGILRILIDVSMQLVGAIVSVVASVASWVTGFIEANTWILRVISVVGSVIAVIGTLAGIILVGVKVFAVLGTIVQVVAAVFMFFMSPIGLIISGAMLLWTALQWLGEKFEWIGNLVDKVTGVMSSLWNGFLGLFGKGTKDAADEASEAIESTAESGKESLEDLSESGTESASNLNENVKSEVSDMSESSKSDISSMSTDGKTSLEGLEDGGLDAISGLSDGTIAEIGDMSNLSLDDLQGLEVDGISAMSGLESGVTGEVGKMSEDVKSKVGDMETSATGDFSGLTKEMSANAKKVRTEVSNAFNGMSKAINAEMGKMRAIASGGMKGVAADIAKEMTVATKTIRTSIETMSREMTKGFTAMNKVVMTSMSAMNNHVSKGMQTIGTTAAQSLTNLIQAFRASFTAINNAINSSMNTATMAVTRAVTSMNRIVHTLQGSFSSAGRHAMSGLRNGLNSGAGSVIATARGIANRVASTMRAALKVKSPSRVTMEIGRWVSEGLADGISKYARLVDEAGHLIADKAVVQPDDFDLSYKTPKGVHTSLSSAVNGSVDVNAREERLIDAIDNLGRRLNNLEVIMDGREVGRVVEPYVSDAREQRLRRRDRGRGY